MSVDYSPNLEPYKYTGSFRFWCQKVLPLVYDDSLSYYELLCKVVNYLNDVISNADGLKVDIDNLLKAYTNLQNFVNTYFESLDVQKEINNKLDQMVDDGSLSLIIEPISKKIIEEWLTKNISGSNTVDKTLNISGACADSKVVGDKFKAIQKIIFNVHTININGLTYRVDWLYKNGNIIAKCCIDLDTVCYESFTYRDIFINNNLTPNADFESGTSWGVITGNASVTTEAYNSPNHSLKCFNSESSYIEKNLGEQEGGIYFVGANVNIKNIRRGYYGVQFFTPADKILAFYDEPTTEFIQVHGYKRLESNTFISYMGLIDNGDGEGYIDDCVAINLTKIFTDVPSKNLISKLYDTYSLIKKEGEIVKEFTLYGDVLGYSNFYGGDINFSIEEKNNKIYIKYIPSINDMTEYGLTLKELFNGKYNASKSGNFENGLNWCEKHNDVSLSTVEYISPNHSLLCQGDRSTYISGLYDITNDKMYFVGCGCKCVEYTSGNIGVSIYQSGKNYYDMVGELNKWGVAGLLIKNNGRGFSWYCGNISNANAKAYFDNLVIINCSDAFKNNIPPENELKKLFHMYNLALLGEAYYIEIGVVNYDNGYNKCVDTFVKAMNKKAREIGMINTIAVSPNGISEDNVTTCRDMCGLTTINSAYNLISKVWCLKNKTINVYGLNAREINLESSVSNENFEQSYKIIGGKTGTLGSGDKAYYALTVIAKDKNDRCFVGCVLNARFRWSAMKNLFDKMSRYCNNPQTDISSPIVDTECAIGWELPHYNCASCEMNFPEPIFEQNGDIVHKSASTIKCLTFLTALDFININDYYTVQYNDIVGGSGNVFKAGDVVRVVDLLYAMMLPSSNTGANCIAHYCGNKILNNSTSI